MLSCYLAPGSSEAVVKRCSVKNVFLKISQNSQENTCAIVSFLIRLQVSGRQGKQFIMINVADHTEAYSEPCQT